MNFKEKTEARLYRIRKLFPKLVRMNQKFRKQNTGYTNDLNLTIQNEKYLLWTLNNWTKSIDTSSSAYWRSWITNLDELIINAIKALGGSIDIDLEAYQYGEEAKKEKRKRKHYIYLNPNYDYLTPNESIVYGVRLSDEKTSVEWYKKLEGSEKEAKIVGASGSEMGNMTWHKPGKHTLICKLKHFDGSIEKITKNILVKPFEPILKFYKQELRKEALERLNITRRELTQRENRYKLFMDNPTSEFGGWNKLKQSQKIYNEIENTKIKLRNYLKKFNFLMMDNYKDSIKGFRKEDIEKNDELKKIHQAVIEHQRTLTNTQEKIEYSKNPYFKFNKDTINQLNNQISDLKKWQDRLILECPEISFVYTNITGEKNSYTRALNQMKAKFKEARDAQDDIEDKINTDDIDLYMLDVLRYEVLKKIKGKSFPGGVIRQREINRIIMWLKWEDQKEKMFNYATLGLSALLTVLCFFTSGGSAILLGVLGAGVGIADAVRNLENADDIYDITKAQSVGKYKLISKKLSEARSDYIFAYIDIILAAVDVALTAFKARKFSKLRKLDKATTELELAEILEKSGISYKYTPKTLKKYFRQALSPEKRGMLNSHHIKIQKYAKEKQIFIIIRDSGEEAHKILKSKKMHLYKPKPQIIKQKTIRFSDTGIKNPENVGLAAFHPPSFKGTRGKKTRSTLKHMTINELPSWFKKGKSDRELKHLLKNMKEQSKYHLYKKYLNEKNFFISGADNDFVIKYKEPGTGKIIEGFFADYDIHGVFNKHGKLLSDEGVSGYTAKCINERLGIDMFQHAGQDTWSKRSLLNISPPVTLYAPDGTSYALKNRKQMIDFYKKYFNLDLETWYKKIKK